MDQAGCGPSLKSKQETGTFHDECWPAVPFSTNILKTATAGFLNKYHQQKF
jgi:hypothetical protein